jgi:hypothetical protein
MITKYKEEIKGALISTGIVIAVLSLFPQIYQWYSQFNHSIAVGLLLLAVGVSWK